MVLVAIISCFFDDYEIDPPTKKKIYLFVDRLLCNSSFQLLLIQPSSLSLPL